MVKINGPGFNPKVLVDSFNSPAGIVYSQDGSFMTYFSGEDLELNALFSNPLGSFKDGKYCSGVRLSCVQGDCLDKMLKLIENGSSMVGINRDGEKGVPKYTFYLISSNGLSIVNAGGSTPKIAKCNLAQKVNTLDYKTIN